MASSPRSGDVPESQNVAAEIFIAAAEVWRLTVTKIELRRLEEEEALDAVDDDEQDPTHASSSRPLTPLAPSFRNGRRQSVEASRRARRRSSIQAAAGSVSMLAVDDATRALLDGLADDASSHNGSRRSSRNASPAPPDDAVDGDGPLLTDEGLARQEGHGTMTGPANKSFARAVNKSMLLKKATGSMLRTTEGGTVSGLRGAPQTSRRDPNGTNTLRHEFIRRGDQADEGVLDALLLRGDDEGEGTDGRLPMMGGTTSGTARRQFRRSEEPSATEEALSQYAFQQELQRALCLGPEDVCKALAAVDDVVSAPPLDASALPAEASSASPRRSKSRNSSSTPQRDAEDACEAYVEEWSHTKQVAALAKAKAVAYKYVTQGQHTQLQKHASFGSSQHSGPLVHRRRGSRGDVSSRGGVSDPGCGGGDGSSGGSPLYRKNFTAFDDTVPSESPVEGLQPSESNNQSSTPTTGSNPSQGIGSFSIVGGAMRGDRTTGGHRPVIVLPGAVSAAAGVDLPAFHSFAEGEHSGSPLKGSSHAEERVLQSSIWTAPKSGSLVLEGNDEEDRHPEGGSPRCAGQEVAGLPQWATAGGRRQSIGSRGSASPPPPADGPSSSSSIVFLKSASNHLIDLDEKVYVRVWTSKREAKKFHRGMAAVAQATHTLLLPRCFAVPYSVLLQVHRCTVSVTWLPPLRSEEPLRIRDRSNRVNLLKFASRAIDCALILGSDVGTPGISDVEETLRRPDERKTLSSLVTTLEGVDGRYYTLFQGLQGGDGSSASSPRSTQASPRSGSRDRASMSPRSGDDRKQQFDGPVWTSIDRRVFSDRVVMDTARIGLSRLAPVATVGDTEAGNAEFDHSDLSPRHGSRSNRSAMSPLLPPTGSGRGFSPRLASTTPSVHTTTTGNTEPISPIDLQYSCSKGLFDCLAAALKEMHQQHHRPIGVPAADVPAAVNAYHSLLMYMSTSQFLRGTFFSGSASASTTAAAKRRKQQKSKVHAAVGYALQYALTLTKEDTAPALLLYCIAGELSQLSTIEHGKRIAKKLSNVSVMQQNLVEWEADAHAIECIAMTLTLHMVECRGKLMLDAAEAWREEPTLQAKPPQTSALEGTKSGYLKRRNSRLDSKSSSGRAQHPAYKFSVANPALVLASLKLAMADMTAVWGTAVADALYRLAFSSSLALFQRVAAQIVLPDHQHTSLKQEDLAKASRNPITGPEGEQDPKRRLQREMHYGMSVARGVLMPLILGVELVHSSVLQVPCDIHGLLYHDRAMSTTTGGGKGIRVEQLATFHSAKAVEQAAVAAREREGKPIVNVVVLAGWLLAYSQLLLPERLVAVTKVARLLRGDDNDTIRLVGKALAITVASAFSIVDLRSSRLMRCISMARNAMICCGAVDMTLIHFALKPLDADDVSAMMDVLCDDIRKITTGASSSSRWSSHQLNAFKTLRHIMQSGSKSLRGNSVFSMNERLEAFGDFRLTVHDADDKLVLDEDHREVSAASADGFPSSTPRSGNLGPSGSSLFRVGFKFGANSGTDRSSPTPSDGPGDRGGGPFAVDSMNATPMDEPLGSTSTANSRWSMSFGRMASSTVFASSINGGDPSAPSSVGRADSIEAAPNVTLPPIRTGSTNSQLLVPAPPQLTPRHSGAIAGTAAASSHQEELQPRTLPRTLSTRSAKTVLLLGSDFDVASKASCNDKPLLLLPSIRPATPLEGGLPSSRSISRRSSLPRVASPVVRPMTPPSEQASPLAKPEDDDLVDWGMSHQLTSRSGGLTTSLSILSGGDDEHWGSGSALPPSHSLKPSAHGGAVNDGWNDDRQSSSHRQHWEALSGVSSSEAHHRSLLERDEAQCMVVCGLRQHMELQILTECVACSTEEEALERRVAAEVAETSQDERIDVGVYGIRRRNPSEPRSDASASVGTRAASVQCDSSPTHHGCHVSNEISSSDGPMGVAECCDSHHYAFADAIDDAVDVAVVDFEACFRELELDVAVARTEVETYERLAFAPLLQAFTKSLMRSALRSIKR